ncbi:threonine synthase [Parafannyhessea umbonata]|uniref:Threonine synthase n=1 Tax=Parafannyhessea umbonata TaxID=604330 RepID=A0A1H9P033_9ACTN|nr:threonine synthase [Parafannyhessea umbonata]SER40943.1 threonine synthase [Parafannyhessea umbonata]
MNTFYHSTRGNSETVTSKQAILTGIAPDGGLFVSDQLGDAKLDLAQVASQTYHETAAQVLSALLDDYQKDEIESCVAGAYGDNFDTSAVTPVSALGDDWLLELYHGPTCAFKDVALQMLPRLMSCARKGDGRNVMIVTATSGDTGKAALAGFTGIEGCGVTVFYPDGKVSDIQRLQMATQEGSNVAVCAIRGTFDDAQTEVKRIFANQELAQRLAERGTMLSSANSINVGRLVPQVTYYFDAYAQLVRNGSLSVGDAVDFCVPTGNFGDVLAGYYAKRLGLPVGKLIVASNTNKVLTDFLETGTYDRRRDFVKTISPSMDILVSSNLERMLYYLTDGDCERVSSFMRDLAEKGFYTLPGALLAKLRETFDCGFATDDETRATIRSAWKQHHVLIDPHTAVAKTVLDRKERGGNQRVCLSTASPYKFSADVLSALGASVDGLGGFACMDELQRLTGIAAPTQLSTLRSKDVLHKDVVDRDQMPDFVESSCKRVFA